jgi:hypothetical protein
MGAQGRKTGFAHNCTTAIESRLWTFRRSGIISEDVEPERQALQAKTPCLLLLPVVQACRDLSDSFRTL